MALIERLECTIICIIGLLMTKEKEVEKWTSRIY